MLSAAVHQRSYLLFVPSTHRLLNSGLFRTLTQPFQREKPTPAKAVVLKRNQIALRVVFKLELEWIGQSSGLQRFERNRLIEIYESRFARATPTRIEFNPNLLTSGTSAR